MNVVVYTRVSSKEQLQGYSLDSQRKLCSEYAEKQGWNVLQIFEEQGESARSADRTQLGKMLEYCIKNKGKVDAVLVHKIDRFARQADDHHYIRAALSRCGVVLRSVNENIDESSTGKFLENMFAAVAQFDNDVRADRTREGLKERVRQGLWAWAPPLGYRNTPTGMVIDEKNATFVRQAFELYASGNYSIKQITDRFNKWGVRTKKDNKLSPQTVTKILENKLYMGIIKVKDWDEQEGLHEKIISPNLFQRAQMVREGRSVSAVPRIVNNPEFPLRGIAKCLSCGKNLTGSKSTGRSNKYAYYHCICGETRVRKERLEESFIYLLKQIQPNEAFIKLFKEILTDVWKMKQQSVLVDKARIDKGLHNLNIRRQMLLEKNLKGIISDDDFKEQMEIVKANIVTNEVERDEIKNIDADIDYLMSLSEELFKKVSTIWLDAPFDQKLRFQQLLFPKGIYYKDDDIGTEELGLPFKLIANANVEKTTLVPPRGVEPLIPWLKTRCPRPLDDGGIT